MMGVIQFVWRLIAGGVKAQIEKVKMTNQWVICFHCVLIYSHQKKLNFVLAFVLFLAINNFQFYHLPCNKSQNTLGTFLCQENITGNFMLTTIEKLIINDHHWRMLCAFLSLRSTRLWMDAFLAPLAIVNLGPKSCVHCYFSRAVHVLSRFRECYIQYRSNSNHISCFCTRKNKIFTDKALFDLCLGKKWLFSLWSSGKKNTCFVPCKVSSVLRVKPI